ADSLGAGQAMIEKAVDYSGQREQFGRLIGSFQAVKHMCAEMAARHEPCRSLVWYAAHAFDSIPEDASIFACHAKS
ncbi:MAG TPA: acyl-CoA dehydrogenase, partial [Hyphomonas sp.]|nr:acyl-CoA dehydrogenase [Hyphomonas sp.]